MIRDYCEVSSAYVINHI